MNNNIRDKGINVICFGEVLWDNLPSGRKPGGAPMNVAYHLQKLGISSSLVSRVGNDDNGTSLLEILKKLDLSTEYCQIDGFNKTSTVEVNITSNNEVEYEIVFPVAWDFIALDPRISALTSKANAIVFGSLAGRNEMSRSTLHTLLDSAKYRVFDVNLRAPYYSESYMHILLGKTDLLKLNYLELGKIVGWYKEDCKEEKEKVQFLQDKFDIKEIIVTKGSDGASFYAGSDVYHQSAYKIIVKDTVGSGDSFLAAFLSSRLKNHGIEESLTFAAALSAFITTHAGACPPYQISDVTDFMLAASKS